MNSHNGCVFLTKKRHFTNTFLYTIRNEQKLLRVNFGDGDFFLWGYLKSKVYSNSPLTIDALKENIRREIAAISPDLCERVIADMKLRVQECI